MTIRYHRLLPVILGVSMSLEVLAYSTGLTGYSGHPSDGETCSYCHYGGAGAVSNCGAATPLGSFNYSGSISATTSVLRGSNQSITFSLTKNGGTTFTYGGMGARINTGSFTGNADVTVSNASGNNTATHNGTSNTPSGTGRSWSWNWTAPATFGNHTLYVCGNPTDGNFTCTGDGPHTNTCDSHTFSVINSRPNSVDDGSAASPWLTVTEDVTTYQAVPDVLANDSDADGADTISVNSGPTGASGDATRSGNNFSYRPGNGYQYLPAYNPADPSTYATDTFTYTITDSTGQSNQVGFSNTVYIRITGVDDPPVAANDGSVGTGFVTVDEGMTVAGPSVLSNDSDPDHVETAVQDGTCGSNLGPSYASAFTLNPNGTFSYTHDVSVQDQTKDSFQYCAVGGSVYSSPVTVYIDITLDNDPPTIAGFAGNDASTTFVEQTAGNIIPAATITLDDPDSSDLNRAILDITGSFNSTFDSLSCPSPSVSGISCTPFNSVTGQLVLTGNATLANYTTAIERVRFVNTSDNPDTGLREISLTLRDTTNVSSATATRIYDNAIVRVNDPPTIAAIANQNAFEDTAADPYTFIYTAVASDVDVNDDTNTGNGSLTYSLSGHPAGMTIDNSAANPGRITWNPTSNGYPATVYGPITVSVEDGDEDGSVPNSVSFNLTVAPPDDDSDMVENYNDFCVSVADGTNLNTDGDGTVGTDGPAADEGGDVCDSDDDGDGMPDTFEIANSLDPLVDDAAGDADGDGVSNLQEYLDGTSPNQVNLVIDATGYLTPYELVAPDPASIHTLATTVTANDYGPYRPGDNTITWTPSNATDDDLATSDPANLVSDPPEQPFFVRPLVSFGVDQQAEENAVVMVTVMLNGDSPSWPANPATVDYTVAGTAGAADHDAVDGTVTFNDGEYMKTINFNTLADARQDPDETVVFTLSDPVNAAIGSNKRHTVTIVEDNVAPQVELQFTQGAIVVGSAYADDGAITVDALVSDVNGAQTHSYDWSGTDNALLPPGDTGTWMIALPAKGNYLIDVIVTDQGNPVPSQSTRMTRILRVNGGTAPALTAADSDGDGTPDNDAAEGYADDDGDGIPNYLDAIDGLVAGGNLVPDQTRNAATTMMLQTESGLRIGRGSTAQAANRFGALLTDREIRRFGDVNGAAPANPGDDQEHIGGIYDFEIRGLLPGASARVVIPLQSGIPRDAEYRKFHPASGWTTFARDNNNRIASASAEDGACPEAGSKLYKSGLNYLDNCLELMIQDGGPNDTDNRRNGVVSDPGTIGTRLTEPETEEVEEGSGRMSPLLMVTMLVLAVFAGWRRRRAVPARDEFVEGR